MGDVIILDMLHELKLRVRDNIKLYSPSKQDGVIKRLKRGGVGCEVGVWRGEFSHRILRKTKPTRLYLVDPWMELPGKEKYKAQYQRQRHFDTRRRIKHYIHNGTARILNMTSDKACKHIPEPLDYVYIDGDHSFAQVRIDLENYYPLIKSGGLLCGDDYADDNVALAVSSFCHEKNLPFEHSNGQYFIPVP